MWRCPAGTSGPRPSRRWPSLWPNRRRRASCAAPPPPSRTWTRRRWTRPSATTNGRWTSLPLCLILKRGSELNTHVSVSLCPDNEWLWLSEASGQRHFWESHSGEGEGERHVLRHEDPQEGSHHSQGASSAAAVVLSSVCGELKVKHRRCSLWSAGFVFYYWLQLFSEERKMATLWLLPLFLILFLGHSFNLFLKQHILSNLKLYDGWWVQSQNFREKTHKFTRKKIELNILCD